MENQSSSVEIKVLSERHSVKIEDLGEKNGISNTTEKSFSYILNTYSFCGETFADSETLSTYNGVAGEKSSANDEKFSSDKKSTACDGKTYAIKKSTGDKENRIVAEFNLNEILDLLIEDKSLCEKCKTEDFYFYGGGWQSWGFGGELKPGEFEKKYIPIIPQLKNYYTFPGKAPCKVADENQKSKKLLNGKFISYFRWNNTYLVLASLGNADKFGKAPLAPLEYYANRKTRKISVVACSQNKKWQKDEIVSKIALFAVNSFFDLKAIIHELYKEPQKNRFENLKFLSSENDRILAAGWESWYNHYEKITQKLIEDDIEALGKTGNIIKTFCFDRKKPVVFQVDDGWEQGLGQWEADKIKFPSGMVNLASAIESKMYIPGLWLAPFIIDFRTDFAQNHLDWILKDENGKYVEAGFSLVWGAKFGKMQPGRPYSYFCLDISREDVLEYLDNLMEKVINVWGFRYLKLDFLFAGMIYGNFQNKKASYELYDRAIKILTKRTKNNKGQDVAYLGCGLPFEPSFNYFPLSRMGSDTTENWDYYILRPFRFLCRPSAVLNMQSTLGHAFWDQSIFVNDPDVIFLRYDNIAMSDKQKETVALVNFMFASQLMHSDDPSAFKPETEGKFTEHILSLYEKFEGVEFAHKNIDSDTYVFFSRDKKYCGIINLSDKEFSLKKNKMLEACGFENLATEKFELSTIVGHFVLEGDVYKTEAHSINIFEV